MIWTVLLKIKISGPVCGLSRAGVICPCARAAKTRPSPGASPKQQVKNGQGTSPTDPVNRITLEKSFFRAVGPCLLPIGEGLLLDDFCRTGEVLAGGIVGGGHGKGVGAVACPTLSALASKKNSCPENDLVRYLRY